MDENTDVVQPDGQGDGGASDAPYAEYLNRIPEEVRGQVEPVFRDWDGQVTRRFQDAAEYRKTWEPFQDTGVTQYSPEQVAWAMQFLDAHDNNPQAVGEWFQGYAQERGLTPAQAQAEAQQTPVDDFGLLDPDALKGLLSQELAPLQQRLEALGQWQAQQQEQARLHEAQQLVRGQMDELKKTHPADFNEAAIEKLVAQYIDKDPQRAVHRAFDDWQAIRSQLERDVLQQKADQPAGATSGGITNGAVEAPKTMQEANAQALARLRQSMS